MRNRLDHKPHTAKEYYGVQVVEIWTAEQNLPSRRVAECLGFEFCGIIANNECVNGKIFNHAMYAYRFKDGHECCQNHP